jgi:hypothetical protein
MPMLVALLPIIGLGFLADEATEIGLLSLSSGLGIASLCLGYREHRSRRALVILAAGLTLLALGRIAEGRRFEPIGVPLVVGGGLVIAASHLLNRRLCRSCRACQAMRVPAGNFPPLSLADGERSGRQGNASNPGVVS